MKPIWRDIEAENPWLRTTFYDFDDDADKIQKYHITGNLPVFIFLDDQGKEIERLHGEFSRKDLLSKINTLKKI
jgi:thiol:disulfide interchange protein